MQPRTARRAEKYITGKQRKLEELGAVFPAAKRRTQRQQRFDSLALEQRMHGLFMLMPCIKHVPVARDRNPVELKSVFQFKK